LPVILLLVRLVPKIQIRDDKSIVIFLCKYEKNQLKNKKGKSLLNFIPILNFSSSTNQQQNDKQAKPPYPLSLIKKT